MAGDLGVLMRPIEITDDNDEFSVNYGGVDNRTLDHGVYGSILTLLSAVETELQAVHPSFTCYLTSDWKFYIEEAHLAWTITWTDKALGVLLGFDDDVASTTSTTATYTPTHLWLPTYPQANNQVWERESNWHGANAIDGTLAGVQLTPGKYRRALSWAAEADTNVWRSRCTASFSYGGTTYYPQEARCLERFLEDCQAAACTATTAGGLNQKGFYLVPDRTIYQGNGNLLSSMDGGGVKYSLSSSNDDYVYCHMQAGEKWQEPSPSIDGMLTYWDVELEAMTSETSPTWDEP